ncbi:methyltransferase [Gemmatimonadota bacterium]
MEGADQCAAILKNCHNAMKPASKLLIGEMIVPPGNQPSIAKLLDLEMLVTTGGCERTEHEYRMLLESSGYHLTKIVSTEESVSVIEAQPS